MSNRKEKQRSQLKAKFKFENVEDRVHFRAD